MISSYFEYQQSAAVYAQDGLVSREDSDYALAWQDYHAALAAYNEARAAHDAHNALEQQRYDQARAVYEAERMMHEAANNLEQERYAAERMRYNQVLEAHHREIERLEQAHESAIAEHLRMIGELTNHYNLSLEEYNALRHRHEQALAEYALAREAYEQSVSDWNHWQSNRPETGEGFRHREIGVFPRPAGAPSFNGNQGAGTPLAPGIYLVGGGNQPLGLLITENAQQGTLIFAQHAGGQNATFHEIQIYEAGRHHLTIVNQSGNANLYLASPFVSNDRPVFSGSPPVFDANPPMLDLPDLPTPPELPEWNQPKPTPPNIIPWEGEAPPPPDMRIWDGVPPVPPDIRWEEEASPNVPPNISPELPQLPDSGDGSDNPSVGDNEAGYGGAGDNETDNNETVRDDVDNDESENVLVRNENNNAIPDEYVMIGDLNVPLAAVEDVIEAVLDDIFYRDLETGHYYDIGDTDIPLADYEYTNHQSGTVIENMPVPLAAMPQTGLHGMVDIMAAGMIWAAFVSVFAMRFVYRFRHETP